MIQTNTKIIVMIPTLEYHAFLSDLQGACPKCGTPSVGEREREREKIGRASCRERVCQYV